MERVPEVVAGNTRERGDGGIERHRRPTAETEILVLVADRESIVGRTPRRYGTTGDQSGRAGTGVVSEPDASRRMTRR